MNTTRAGDPRFYRLLDEIANLHARKSSDYSPGSDPLANFRASAEFGVRPYLGILTRLRDKWGRITNFAKGGVPQNESQRDSHIDSAVYHLLAVLLLEDEQPAVHPRVMAQARAAAFLLEPLPPETGPDPDYGFEIAVSGSDDPAGVYEAFDEPFPLPQFGPGSPAATTAGSGARVYAGEDSSALRQQSDAKRTTAAP